MHNFSVPPYVTVALHEVIHAAVVCSLGYSGQAELIKNTNRQGDRGYTHWDKRAVGSGIIDQVTSSISPLLWEFLTGGMNYRDSSGDFKLIADRLDPFCMADRAIILKTAISTALDFLVDGEFEYSFLNRITAQLLKTSTIPWKGWRPYQFQIQRHGEC